ncbi:hypothetical protein OO17_05325 [Rhodopseudomonas palustris]|uniref:DUF3617 family protein n=1 Tax=Rhodopseudomonas palustris TaxID=1076 RepID=A0A0D7F2E1_RHOPL|nr:hypothetical protein OO17_05325 [Rhodopseudomonas palustris]
MLGTAPAWPSDAVELPVRKPGLWEMKMDGGAQLPTVTMQHCTDETIDKQMSTAFSPMSKEVCAKNEIRKTATGYSTDADCSAGGMSTKTHADITGDFNSAYTVKVTSHQDGGPTEVPRDATMMLQAKWLGACKPGQKPGDVVMPGGFKMNIKDIEKLKALMPK